MGNMRLHREVRIELITLWVLRKAAVSGGIDIGEGCRIVGSACRGLVLGTVHRDFELRCAWADNVTQNAAVRRYFVVCSDVAGCGYPCKVVA